MVLMNARLISITIVASILISTVTSAVPTNLSFRGTVTAGDVLTPTAIRIGDTFRFDLTLNLDAIDSNAMALRGDFLNALVAIEIRKLAGVGTWNPNGTLLTPHDIITFDNIPQDSLSILGVGATDFPLADGRALDFLGLSWTDFSHSTVSDSGIGQSLGDQLGANTGLPLFNVTGVFNLRFLDGYITNGDLELIPHSATVPDRTGILIVLMAAAAIATFSLISSKHRRRPAVS